MKRLLFWTGAVLFPLALITAWHFIVRLDLVPKSQAAAPSDVLVRLWGLITSGTILVHSGYSLLRLLSGIALGVLAGIIVSICLAKSRSGEQIFSPTLQILAGVPVVVWIPFWVMFFGTGEAFKVGMVGISTFFIVFFHSFVALRAVERDYMELADLYEKDFWQKVWQVLLPSSAPAILTATRTALAFGWVVIFFVEYASAREGTEGLGWFIADARQVGQKEEEFAGLLFLAVLAFASDFLISKLQRYLVRWSDTLDDMVRQEI